MNGNRNEGMKVAHHHHGELKGRMLFSFALNIVITLAEVIGGILSAEVWPFSATPFTTSAIQ